MHIGHIAIWTNNLEQLKDFYVRYFGCTASERYDNPRKQFSSYFVSFQDGAGIELMKRSDITKPPDSLRTGLAHFALLVGTAGEVDSLTAFLEKEGVTVEGYPRTTGDGCYESVILDPDGNRIELTAHKQ